MSKTSANRLRLSALLAGTDPRDTRPGAEPRGSGSKPAPGRFRRAAGSRPRAAVGAGISSQYAKDGFYDGTIFHRVVNGFVIQGGGLHDGDDAEADRGRRFPTSPATA